MIDKLNLALLAIAISFAFFLLLKSQLNNKKFVKVKIGNLTVDAEVADNFLKRSVGLSNKTHLKNNEGMLFVFKNEGIYGFWMRRMKFPIDIIWISKEKKIIGCDKNLQPCVSNCKVYKPPKPILYVLEVNTGFCDKHKIRPGQRVSFDV